jgi:catechol 2,3-dioxygenase-like lactoylglutathione lyase family enzyme
MRRCVAMPPPISHLLETALYVEDLEAAARFYRRVFALPVMLEDERMVALALPGSAVLLLFRIGGSVHPSTVPGGVIPAHGARGAQHLCLAIPVASLQGWERHLLEHDVVIESRVIQSHGGTSLYFRDPDGHSLEVATPGLWPIY